MMILPEHWEREKAGAKGLGTACKEIAPPGVIGNPPKSNPIKPDQTESKRKKKYRGNSTLNVIRGT
jgi:hypothetical protein